MPGGQVTWFAVPDGGSAAHHGRRWSPRSRPAGWRTRSTRVTATTALTWSGPAGPARLFVRDAAPGGGARRGHRVRPGHLPDRPRHVHGVPRRHPDLVGPGAPGRPPDLDLSGLDRRRARASFAAQVRSDVADTPPSRRHLLRRQGAAARGPALPAREPARPDDAAGRVRDGRRHGLGPLDRPARLRRATGVLLRLRPDAPRRRRAHPVVRVGGVQRPPLPLRLLPLRRRRARRRRPGARGAAGARSRPARRRHRRRRRVSACCRTAGSSTPYAAHSWAQRHVAVRRRQQPGVQLARRSTRGSGSPCGPTPRGNRPCGRRPPGCWPARQDSAVRYGLRPDRATRRWRTSTTRSCRSPGAASATTRRGSRPSRRRCSASCCCPPTPSTGLPRGRPGPHPGRGRRGDRGQGYDQQFGDYLLMYAALAGPADARAALDQARTLRRQVGRRRQQPLLPARLADGAGALRMVAAQPNWLSRNRVRRTARSACSGRTRTRR